MITIKFIQETTMKNAKDIKEGTAFYGTPVSDPFNVGRSLFIKTDSSKGQCIIYRLTGHDAYPPFSREWTGVIIFAEYQEVDLVISVGDSK